QEARETIPEESVADVEHEAAVASLEPLQRADDSVEDDPELDRIAELSGQEFAMALLQHSGDLDSSIENMLVMIESGRIDVNKRIAELGNSQAMTPFLLAVGLSQGQLTLDQFHRFLDVGVTLQNDELSKEMMASLDNPEVIEAWYETAAFGPEDHEQLLNNSLKNGNLTLAEIILEDKKGELDGIKLSSDAIAGSITRIQAIAPLELQELKDELAAADEKELKMAESFLIPRLQNSVDETEILLQYAELSEEQRTQVIAANERYKDELEELKEILSTHSGE
ncbi:hypothetical protein C9986_02260, partial [Pseudidiomarina aestuarii]